MPHHEQSRGVPAVGHIQRWSTRTLWPQPSKPSPTRVKHQHTPAAAARADTTGIPTKPEKRSSPTPAQTKTHYSVSSLKHRGWTDAMVRDLLGDPDKRSVNPHYRKAAQTHLYAIERVHETEATEAFAERLAKAEKRRAARAK